MGKNEYIGRIEKPFRAPVKIYKEITLPTISSVVIFPPIQSYPHVTSEKYMFSGCGNISVRDPDGNTEVRVENSYNTSGSYEFKKTGTYYILYQGQITRVLTGPEFVQATFASNFYISFRIVVSPKYKQPPKWNIKTVLDRVFNLTEPRLLGTTPKYRLDPAQAAEFEKIEAPQFAFTQLTLKGILDQIGGYIHGIPRLIKGESGEFDTVHYNMLGGTEEAQIGNSRYVSEMLSQNIEDYATDIDSAVDYCVNTIDSEEGSIADPYDGEQHPSGGTFSHGGFKTVRTDEMYARIEEKNMMISTALPIHTIQKLEVLIPGSGANGTASNIVDITPYVVEATEYGTLSLFMGAAASKAYSLYYNIGEKGIYGLNYRAPKCDYVQTSGTYAITNIINAASKGEFSVTSGYDKLAFRVTYTPIFATRVYQHKPYIEPNVFKRSLWYNQGGNRVEAKYYGENLKGTIARMGNAEVFRTYRMEDLSSVPKIGQVWRRESDDYYVTSVSVAVHADFAEFTVGFSKDFNRLSQYVGVNSEWRAFEVSERNVSVRNIVYRDFCIIGDKKVVPNGECLLSTLGRTNIANTFSQQQKIHDRDNGMAFRSSQPISLARCITYNNSEPSEYTVTLPVTSSAFGDALVFAWEYADNYSAGAKAEWAQADGVNGYWQTDAQYTDYFGRVDNIKFELCTYGKGMSYGSYDTFTLPQVDVTGRDVALGSATLESVAMVGTGENRMVVDKDSSEALRFGYQLEFVTNSKDIIIGPAMTRNCPLVRKVMGEEHAAALYVLPNRIGKFDKTIDISKATQVTDYNNGYIVVNAAGLTTVDGYIELLERQSPTSGLAWAIVDKATGEILIARNKKVEAGETIRMPILSFTHNID